MGGTENFVILRFEKIPLVTHRAIVRRSVIPAKHKSRPNKKDAGWGCGGIFGLEFFMFYGKVGSVVMSKRLRISTKWRVACLVGAIALPLFTGCQDIKKTFTSEKKESKENGNPDVSFLLSMSYAEAKAISPKNLIFAPFYKIAADEITVDSTDSQGMPKRVRAKGHVFLQIDYRDEVHALGQEALISANEVILRGKPLMKRGSSVVEGLDDFTVFYIEGTRLHVIGEHRLTNESGVTSTWKNTWRDGPNPLLPALSPDDVPKEMRASPLLPPLPGMEKPKP
jgi:hypothetical protein